MQSRFVRCITRSVRPPYGISLLRSPFIISVIFKDLLQVCQLQYLLMPHAPNPTALSVHVDGDALDRELAVVRDDPEELRREELDRAQDAVRGAGEDRRLCVRVPGRDGAERVDRRGVAANTGACVRLPVEQFEDENDVRTRVCGRRSRPSRFCG